MITDGAKLLQTEQTSGHQWSKAFTGGADKWSLTSKAYTNGAEPLLAEPTSDPYRSNTFTSGADRWSPSEQILYWRSRQVVTKGAKPLLA